jgi:hypothetical protein
MKVGFDRPFEPRLTERFPAWLSASMVVHAALNQKYATAGLRFVAASDDANQQLVRHMFDGRRSVMTMASEWPTDLLKLPVYGFYELLPFLSGVGIGLPPNCSDTTLYGLAAVDVEQIGVLLTNYADRFPPETLGPASELICEVANIPWERINIVCFRIDHIRTNAFSAWKAANSGGRAGKEAAGELRMKQELGVVMPMRSGLRVSDRSLTHKVQLPGFATGLVWITPFTETVPAAPSYIKASPSDGNVILRWTPDRNVHFYTYEVFRKSPGQASLECISPVPLRSATWVDTSPRSGIHLYSVRTVTASGKRSELVEAQPLRV